MADTNLDNSLSLKDYYKNIQVLYANAVNMMTALNQSLTSSSSNVYVNLVDNSGETYKTVQLPSLLYLENKLEELETNFSSLFNVVKSGEAWFDNDGDMTQMHIVNSDTTPVTPEINETQTINAYCKDNNFLKDLVSPKLYLKVFIDNLPNNVEKMFMKKIIINSASTFSQLNDLKASTEESGEKFSYEVVSAALYNLTKGIDYDEYDSVIDLPLKSDIYDSNFKILEIKYSNEDFSEYNIVLNTLQYTDAEDSSITHTLSKDNMLALYNSSTIYQITNVDITNMTVHIVDHIGHSQLTTTEENNQMYFTLHDKFNKYHEYSYVEVPLEENQYICVFLGTIYNNVRSLLSTPILVDLKTVTIYENDGTSKGNYLAYYNTYCSNIGDLILGLTESAYPQISNYNNNAIDIILNGENVQAMVTNSISEDNQLQVLPINNHLVNTTTTEEILSLHSQKSDLNSQLNSLKDNIDNVYNKLITTDFSKEVDITQESLQAQLQQYYAQRTTIQKQLNAVVDNINAISSDVTIAKAATKYRIRGVTNPSVIENYLQDPTIFGDTKLYVIGLECEYKYKSVLKDSTYVHNINSTLFTDWNRLNNIDRQRKLKFDESSNKFVPEYVDYSDTQNIIKWNQIDIPITKGEDVIIRIRYKYNVGQPFINLYSPWSDEMTIMFPAEYMDSVEVSEIIATNEEDSISAKFSETLISDGYQEHINNALTVGDNTFYHMPENIYSGFNTPENNMISLKDKLNEMSTDLANTKSMIEREVNKRYTVSVSYDEGNVELFDNIINRISIWNNNHTSDTFIKKKMNLVIKNIGDVDVRLYSIFPGNIETPLLLTNNEFYEQRIRHYERVPMYVNNTLSYQTLGQWIYFRQDNPYTTEDVYLDDSVQNLQDYRMLNSNAANLYFTALNSYIRKDYSQALLGYRKRNSGEIRNIIDVTWMGLDFQEDGTFKQFSSTIEVEEADYTKYAGKGIDFFFYKNDLSNNYLTRFEDICGTNELANVIYLDEHTAISDFVSRNTVNGIQAGMSSFVGGFLYPDLLNRTSILTEGKDNSYVKIETGKSISIPITFEYALDGEYITKITKALYFDLRDSLDHEPQHYMLEVTGNYDFSASGSAINNGFGI